jgi:hypothetical protein
MVNRAEGSRKVYIRQWQLLSPLIHPYLQCVDTFVYEMGLQELDLSKRAKIDYLKLSSNEWSRVGQFADLLSVCTFKILLDFT